MAVEQQRSRTWLYASLGIASLLAAAFYVVFVLPSHVAHERPPGPSTATAEAPAPAAEPAPAAPPARDAQRLAEQRELAERLQADALRQLARAEANGASRWGAEALPISFGDAQQALFKANQLHDERAYEEASAGYRSAIDLFAQLDETRAARFDLAMQRSKDAYEAKQPDHALGHAEVALLLRPDSTEAREAVARARDLPQILAHLQAAGDFEKAGSLENAISRYDAILLLDPAFPEAQQTKDRLQSLLDERNFQTAVSTALNALDRKDFAAANAAIATARRIRPSSPEIRELAGRVELASRASTLESLSRQAERLEQEEKWVEALALYDRALAIDRNASFALRGKARSQQFVSLHAELDRYIAAPTRLYSAEPLAHAQGIAKQASALEAAPQLKSKAHQLEQLITAATTPVAVRVRSDQQTDVVIYRVGRLGSFTEREIRLRPGTYVLTGTRTGYRDIRTEIEVAPNARDLVITIQCTEPARP